MNIRVMPLSPAKMKPKIALGEPLPFGRHFTDRMLLAEWRADWGWSDPIIVAHEPFRIDPAAMVFHYAQEVFEGLKAYRWRDGKVTLFRPEMNARRFNDSADRLCLPEVPEELFVEGIERLVFLERDWIPDARDGSLYIRPAMIAVEAALGVRPANHFYFYVIMSPVGSYYAGGFNPVGIMIEDRYVRAVEGGTGAAKTGTNYARSLKAAAEAKKKGFDQVLWLDGREGKYIEEVGAMNMFFVYGKKIVTPPLNGSILPGVTRDSVLKLAPLIGYEVEERPVAVDALMADVATGKVTEAFGTGTAAVISPVGRLAYREKMLAVGTGAVGEATRALYTILVGIQRGIISDPFGWVRFVCSDPAFRSQRP